MSTRKFRRIGGPCTLPEVTGDREIKTGDEIEARAGLGLEADPWWELVEMKPTKPAVLEKAAPFNDTDTEAHRGRKPRTSSSDEG